MASARKETERTKFIQDKCQTLLTQMLRDEDNKYCVDCDAKGPRWASWNLGVFLCIRCAGIHRNLGVHISRVRSVNLDTWSPEQVVSLQNMGNSRARAVYEAQLPDGFRRPQTDSSLETFIRAKYEHKKYMAREWVPQPPAVSNWDREIDEEMEQQKRKKKTGPTGVAFGMPEASATRKPAATAPTAAPVALAKPAPSPKSSRTKQAASAAAAAAAAVPAPSSASSDLLGLTLPTSSTPAASNGSGITTSHSDDLFSNFLSAAPASVPAAASTNSNGSAAPKAAVSLADQEADFFNQVAPTEQEKGKLTRDSIMALYGQAPVQQQQQPPQQQQQFNNGGGFGQFNMTAPNQQHQQQQQQQQQIANAFGSLGAFSNAQQFPAQHQPPQQQQSNMFANFGQTGAFGGQPQQQQQSTFAQFPPMGGSTGVASNPMPFGVQSSVFAAPPQNGGSVATNAAALNQKLNSLNLGNVWQ